MWQFRYVVGFVLVVLSGCSSALKQSPIILDDALSQALVKLDESMSEERTQLQFHEGRDVNTCESYILESSKRGLVESVNNQLVKSEYLICDALNLLADSNAAFTEGDNNTNIGELLQTKLDLRSFPSSLNRMSSEESHTLSSLFPDKVSTSGNIAELETDDLVFILRVVAITQLDDNSIPDWVVWVSDESKSGNYRGYSTLLLYDPQEQQRYAATVYP